jgi:predicted TIM-barrel fold metal-dependent hydrolase
MTIAAQDMQEIVVNPENKWRTETPGAKGWQRSARPDSDKKYFMISVDSHLGTPPTLFRERIEKKYVDRLPRIEVRDGVRFLVLEGRRPMQLIKDNVKDEDLARSEAGSSTEKSLVGEETKLPKRIADQIRDGIDGEVIFPNGPGLLMWGTHDPEFTQAQCRIWNDWAMEKCGPYKSRCNPAAGIAPADLDGSIKEVQRVAKLGYRVLTLPCKPVWGPTDASHVNYNLPYFDPLWAAIQDADLAMTFHISTGTDPRGARGDGGAVINYAIHSIAPTAEPVVNLCASGVLERFPKLRFATIEANAGWVPFILSTMDEAYKKHHMWVSPKLKLLPSEYYRMHGAASAGDDKAAMLLVEHFGLENNFMYANDYPHHEGCWPHSAATIERTMGQLKEETRAKVLGLNAAKFFKFDIPDSYGMASR